MLAFISGLSAAWLIAGGAACALPILAHMRSRRARVALRFPAMRFVAQAMAREHAGRRLRRWLLLLLRLLAVALLALAFDRPVWMSTWAAGADANSDLVVIVDRSASMSRELRGRTLFERAQREAIEVLRSVDPGSYQAGLVFAQREPEAALPALTGNVGALVESLQDTACSLESADLVDAIERASELPDSRRGAEGVEGIQPRRIVVISDMQGIDADALESIDPSVRARLEFHRIGKALATGNVSIHFAGASPAAPSVGEDVDITFLIRNASDVERMIGVEFTVNGVSGLAEPMLVPSWGEMNITLTAQFDAVGDHRVGAKVDADNASYDDRAFGVVRVTDARRVGLLTADSPGDRRAASHYIEAALDAADEIDVRRISVVDPAAWTGFDTLVISGLETAPAETASALARWQADGGTLIWMLDSEAAARIYSDFAQDSEHQTHAPTTLTGAFSVSPSGAHREAGSLNPTLFATRALTGSAGAALEASRFSALAPAELRPTGVAMLTLDDGSPLIAMSETPGSATIVMHADVSPARSDLARSPIFPVLMLELVRAGLATAGNIQSMVVGQARSLSTPAPEGFSPPMSDSRGLRVGARLDGDDILMFIDSPDAPGFISVQDAQGQLIATVGVEVDPSESDLAPPEVEALVGARADVENIGAEPAAAVVEANVIEIQLWPYLLMASLVILGAETLIAGGRPRRARTGGRR